MASATATHPAETKAPGPKHNIEAMREDYYQRIAKHGMTPLWKVMNSVVTKEPVTRCAPVIWHYDDIKRLVMESGGLITAEEAERRVLILENPGMRGESRATNTLFAGVQMILPGEVAPAHRHVSSAIRFVLDGEGAYTAVEGEKSFMAPGDFVITANWAPHDHGNTSDKPMLWLDVLDFPQVNFFEASFAEHFEEATQSTNRADGDSLAFFWFPNAPEAQPGVSAPVGMPGEAELATAHGSMNHVAFDVPSEKFDEYRQRLKDKGVRVGPVLNHDESAAQVSPTVHPGVYVRSFYFHDPDGITLEFACWVKEFTDADTQTEPKTSADRRRPVTAG